MKARYNPEQGHFVTNEKLLVVKERYLKLTDYDAVSAEILSKLDTCNGWKTLPISEWQVNLTIKDVHGNTLRRKFNELVEDGLLEDKLDGRTKAYRVTETLKERVDALGLQLVSGVMVKVENFSGLDTTVEYKGHQNSELKANQSSELSEVKVTKTVSVSESKGHQSSELSDPKLTKTVSFPPYITTVTDESPNTSLTDDKSTSSKSEESTSHELDSSKPNISHSPSKRGRKKFYDYRHYEQFTAEDWKKARTESIWPKKENAKTLLIGAYLLGMWRRHQLDDPLATGEYNKYLPLAHHMLEFFTHRNNGDEQAGFNASLKYIKEFLSCSADSYQGKATWAIALCFTRDSYRHWRGPNRQGKKINDTGIIVDSQKERDKRADNAIIIRDGKRVRFADEGRDRSGGDSQEVPEGPSSG